MTYVSGGQRGQCVRAELESHRIGIPSATFPGICHTDLVVRDRYEGSFLTDARPLDKVRLDDNFDAADKFALVHATNSHRGSGADAENASGIVARQAIRL